MNIIDHAKRELKLAGFDPNLDPVVSKFIWDSLIKLLGVYKDISRVPEMDSIILEFFNILARGETLSPLNGTDSEWIELNHHDDDIVFQNVRNNYLFKCKDGTVKYSNGVIQNSDGYLYPGPFFQSKEDAMSNKNQIGMMIVKSFPFEPKTFILDVDSIVLEDGTKISWVKDPNQLNDVWEIYQKPNFI